MRIALLVAAHRFTGAAAVAEHWCRALRTRDLDAQLIFRKEGNLQWRLKDCEWAHALLVKERRLSDLAKNLRIIRGLGRDFDAVISFLPHDHALAAFSGLSSNIPLLRAYRHPRHLKPNPFSSFLGRRCAAVLTPYETLRGNGRRLTGCSRVQSIPVAVEPRFYRKASGGNLLRKLGIPAGIPIIGAVGKLAAGRGFELILQAAARSRFHPHLLIVGHGEHQEILKNQAAELGISRALHWAGKREAELPLLLRRMNALLFTAPGSDWGHRAITEAQACGTAVIATPIPGVGDLIKDGLSGLIRPAEANALAQAFDEICANPDFQARLRSGGLKASGKRSFEIIGRALHLFLQQTLDG